MTEENVNSIVHDWLVENNFESIVSERCECGCSIDDLMPCGFDRIGTCLPEYGYTYEGEDYCSLPLLVIKEVRSRRNKRRQGSRMGLERAVSPT